MYTNPYSNSSSNIEIIWFWKGLDTKSRDTPNYQTLNTKYYSKYYYEINNLALPSKRQAMRRWKLLHDLHCCESTKAAALSSLLWDQESSCMMFTVVFPERLVGVWWQMLSKGGQSTVTPFCKSRKLHDRTFSKSKFKLHNMKWFGKSKFFNQLIMSR